MKKVQSHRLVFIYDLSTLRVCSSIASLFRVPNYLNNLGKHIFPQFFKLTQRRKISHFYDESNFMLFSFTAGFSERILNFVEAQLKTNSSINLYLARWFIASVPFQWSHTICIKTKASNVQSIDLVRSNYKPEEPTQLGSNSQSLKHNKSCLMRH